MQGLAEEGEAVSHGLKDRYIPLLRCRGGERGVHGPWGTWIPRKCICGKKDCFITTLYMWLYVGAIEMDQK